MRGPGGHLGRPLCRLLRWPEASRSHLGTSSFSHTLPKDSTTRAGGGAVSRKCRQRVSRLPWLSLKGARSSLKRDPSLCRQDGENDKGSSHTGGTWFKSPLCCQGVGGPGHSASPLSCPQNSSHTQLEPGPQHPGCCYSSQDAIPHPTHTESVSKLPCHLGPAANNHHPSRERKMLVVEAPPWTATSERQQRAAARKPIPSAIPGNQSQALDTC